MDHLERKSLKLQNISYCVLDEADEMLNMGFIDDVEDILKHTNPKKRMMLFSATMPDKILTLAKKYMNKFELVSVKNSPMTVAATDQIYFEVNQEDKFEALCRIIDMENEFFGLIFCRTKVDVDKTANMLIDRGYDADALHGDISQFNREKILQKFKKHKINILVATDVAARGIDIIELTHVINYSLPQDPESYVHRIGRTGRAGKEGTAITFVTPEEYRKLVFIKRVAKTDIRKEQLPQIKDVINSKKLRIKDEIKEIIAKADYNEYLDLAEELISENDSKNSLAAVLKYAFQDVLDEKNYGTIRDVSIDKKGTARLFVALGKVDDMTNPKLVDFITEQAHIDQRRIKDIRIFDRFSFITVPFEEAEVILEIFKKRGRGQKPMVEKAKPRK